MSVRHRQRKLPAASHRLHASGKVQPLGPAAGDAIPARSAMLEAYRSDAVPSRTRYAILSVLAMTAGFRSLIRSRSSVIDLPSPRLHGVGEGLPPKLVERGRFLLASSAVLQHVDYREAALKKGKQLVPYLVPQVSGVEVAGVLLYSRPFSAAYLATSCFLTDIIGLTIDMLPERRSWAWPPCPSCPPADYPHQHRLGLVVGVMRQSRIPCAELVRDLAVKGIPRPAPGVLKFSPVREARSASSMDIDLNHAALFAESPAENASAS